MAQSDWGVMPGSIDYDSGDPWFGNVVRRGITSGVGRPTGGGTFLFGFNSTQVISGCVGIACAVDNFAPIEQGASPDGSQGGGSIRACVKRGVGGGRTGFSPFLFMCAQGNSVNDEAYILGLEDANPSRIVLVKGTIANGVPNVQDSGTTKVLRYSQDGYDWDVWHHLRLDVVVNANFENSDVILRAYRNRLDVSEATVLSPTWEPIAFNDALSPLFGDGAYIDDALAVNSGSTPFASGYTGFGFRVDDISRRAYFDHFQVIRQMPIT